MVRDRLEVWFVRGGPCKRRGREGGRRIWDYRRGGEGWVQTHDP